MSPVTYALTPRGRFLEFFYKKYLKYPGLLRQTQLEAVLQGDPLKSTPRKFSKYKIPSKLARSYKGILYLKKLGGVDFSGSPGSR